MRALVTGGNGFLGSHLCDALVRAGHEARVTVQPGTGLENLAGIDVESVPADLSDKTSLQKACEGVDVVFHLAALVSDYGPWERFRKVNVEGTAVLLDAAVASGVKRFVFMSSLSIHSYADWREATEETPIDPGENPYARSKAEGERLIRDAHAAKTLEGVIVRPGYVPFGPRDRTSFALLASAIERGIYRQVGSGRARTCTAYAPNLAEGLVLCGTHERAAGEAFVLADDGAPTWRELNGKIAAALGVKLPRLSVPGPLAVFAGDTLEKIWKALGRAEAPPLTSYRVRVPLHSTHFSNGKAKRLLGFAPRVSFDEGLAKTVAWYRRARREGSV